MHSGYLYMSTEQKIKPKKLGPFIVSRVVNYNAYKLNLLVYLQIWPIFNVDWLEPYTPLLPDQSIPTLSDPDIIDNNLERKVDAIVDAKRQNDTYYYHIH